VFFDFRAGWLLILTASTSLGSDLDQPVNAWLTTRPPSRDWEEWLNLQLQPSSIWVEVTTAFDTRQETVSLKPAQPGPIAFKVSY
jgi:hypothetical protein